MPDYYFSLNLSADEYLEYYRGRARYVVAESDDGLRIQFPAGKLQPFVTAEGVSGRFCLTCGADRKFQALRKVAEI